jgi:2-hydroxy-6-oxonona-2,4-dienedioate hydrolase
VYGTLGLGPGGGPARQHSYNQGCIATVYQDHRFGRSLLMPSERVERVEREMIGIESPTGVGSVLDVAGIQTYFVERGDGEPVVMIHGAAQGACAQVSWQPNLEPLARAGFWTIAYDQPGFGRSDVPADHSVEARVRHAKAFIDALGLTHYHLIGSSMGAYVAARLALEDPRVDRLVLVAGGSLVPGDPSEADAAARQRATALPSAPPTLDSVRALTEQTLVRRELITEELVRARFEASDGRRFVAHVARQSVPPPRSIRDELPKLTQKTLILWGKNDRGATVERALRLFDLIPGAELHVFDECGHWVQWDQAARFNRIVSDFLRGG